MTVITLYNPYFEKTYEVVENIGDIKYALLNIEKRDKEFLHLHDFETGNPIIINPKNCACIDMW